MLGGWPESLLVVPLYHHHWVTLGISANVDTKGAVGR